jgi:hypothetical protein
MQIKECAHRSEKICKGADQLTNKSDGKEIESIIICLIIK